MPLSDFLWSPLHSSGVKRKTSNAGCIDYQEQVIKRRCLASGDNNLCDMDDENHNESASQNLNHAEPFTKIIHQNQIITQLPNQPAMNQSHQKLTPTEEHIPDDQYMTQGHQQITCSGDIAHIQPSPILQQQPLDQRQNVSFNEQNMIMDLNDEVYSNSRLSDEEMACSYMESDYVPDQQQYQPRDYDAALIGESTSSIERVKCFCRPSWEGLLEMKPYVSDYY